MHGVRIAPVTDPQTDGPRRMPVPFTSPPQLTLPQAILVTLVTFVRIVLGSMLFATWGTSSLHAWSTLHNIFARIAAVSLMLLLSAAAFFLLLKGTGRMMRGIRRHP